NTPAMNRSLIETLAITPYRINTILGGIIGPIVDAVAINDVVNPWSYPSLNIVGISIPPIAAAAAMAVPVIAEKNTLLTMTTNANPPGIGPTMILENSIKRLDIPPLAIISPAKMNNGMATRVKLFTPLKIFLGTFVSRLKSFAAIPIIEINAIENAIGTLIIISINSSM